jgi:hypothetical protein
MHPPNSADLGISGQLRRNPRGDPIVAPMIDARVVTVGKSRCGSMGSAAHDNELFPAEFRFFAGVSESQPSWGGGADTVASIHTIDCVRGAIDP